MVLKLILESPLNEKSVGSKWEIRIGPGPMTLRVTSTYFKVKKC